MRPTGSPPSSTEPVPMIIGIGNENRGDDRCGLEVVRALRARLGPRAETRECGDPTRLLDLWEHARLVLVVDAVRSGCPPGTIHRIEVGSEALPAPLSTTSTHGLSLAHAISLGQSLGRMPGRLVVYGIEAGEVGPGGGLTPSVARALDEVIARVAGDVLGVPSPTQGPVGSEAGAHA